MAGSPVTLDAAIIDLWTDGSGTVAGKPGGWAFVLLHPASNSRRDVAGHVPDATNNRMELTAVIEGLRAISRPSVVFVYSDSEYVVNAFREGWLRRWKRRQWVKVKNPDLWQALDAEVSRHTHVQFEWVKGHDKIELNERCDELAGQARKTGQAFDSGRMECRPAAAAA